MSSSPAVAGRALAMRLPAAVVVGMTVGAAALIHTVLALRSPSPWIVPDELIYSELAKSLGQSGLPRVRGEVSFEWGLGYPALLAPVWAVVDDIGSAYVVAKAWNALILAATAVPAYFLARRFVEERLALVVAALSVSVPPMLYAGTLMTEVALYPALVVALLTMSRAVEQSTIRAQGLALVAIGLACTIKTVAVVLLVAYCAAILAFHWIDRRNASSSRRSIRSYAFTWISLGLLSAAAGLVALVSGRPQDALGGYANVIDYMRPAEVPRWLLLHLAELDLAVAVIPFAATLIIVAQGVRSDATRSEKLFVALFVPVVGAWLLAAASFASVPFLEVLQYPENVQRLQGRSTFMLTPIFFIGLAMWLRDRRGRTALIVCAATVAAFLPAAIPIHDFDGHVRFQALALVPWVALREEVAWPLGLLVFTCGLGLLFVVAFRIRASAALFLVPVVCVFAAVGVTAHLSMRWASEGARDVTAGTAANWVDSAVGKHEEVSVLWAEPPGEPFAELHPRQYVVFVGEFFNQSMGPVYEIGTPLPYNLPSTPVRLQNGRIVLENGRPARLGKLLLVPCHVRVEGTTVARDRATGAGVFRVGNPVRAVVTDPTSCPNAP
jgi:Dolichyl-phosphate-mannose-protein mannosyltransferase